MTHVTCRLTAKNRDQLRYPTLGNRVWVTFTFLHLSLASWLVVILLEFHIHFCSNKNWSLQAVAGPEGEECSPHRHTANFCTHNKHRQSLACLIYLPIYGRQYYNYLMSRHQLLHKFNSPFSGTPPLSFYRPDALPAAQPTASKH